jgi:hypothetical protein
MQSCIIHASQGQPIGTATALTQLPWKFKGRGRIPESMYPFESQSRGHACAPIKAARLGPPLGEIPGVGARFWGQPGGVYANLQPASAGWGTDSIAMRPNELEDARSPGGSGVSPRNPGRLYCESQRGPPEPPGPENRKVSESPVRLGKKKSLFICTIKESK